ncbi:MAG: DegT/DnrJ/EryC1/StrS family aminotransferase [Gammaproteobacteria bacterium]|nr:DegT/DnrJ/EryC1/StrS family aminotransferase [Gammaproteobacteria bacterium]
MVAMWPCKGIDLDWSDWAFALRECLSPSPIQDVASRVERLWSSESDTLACLTVRSAFDLYLRAQRWEPGSEVVFSALTVPDMPRIARHHGFRAVPLDLDPGTAAWDEAALERCVGERTRALVLSHLFGGRVDLNPALAFARRRGIAVVEDCAEAYAGPDWTGHAQADLSLFSFGPIKTATALGGALARVRDPDTCARMKRIHAQDGVQPTGEYLRRVLLYGALKAASHPRALGIVMAAADALGADANQWIHSLTRNVPDESFIPIIRRRPCAALLGVLERRLAQGTAPVSRRVEPGRTLMAALGPDVEVPARTADPHGYWMFPVLTRNPDALSAALRERGFDAMSGRLAVVSDGNTPTPGAERLADALYISFDPDMPGEELERLGRLVRDFEADEKDRTD